MTLFGAKDISNTPVLPHRLVDNLQWRCSSCHSIVPTNQTQFHLSSCYEIKNSSDSNHISLYFGGEELHRKLRMESMERMERPRTKKLERPTPNLNHPIISEYKCKQIEDYSKDKNFVEQSSGNIQTKNMNSLDSGEKIKVIVNESKASEVNNTKLRNKKSCIKLCDTCIRDGLPEKFHCQHVSINNKSLINKKSKTDGKLMKNSKQKASNQTTSQFSSQAQENIGKQKKTIWKCYVCNSSITHSHSFDFSQENKREDTTSVIDSEITRSSNIDINGYDSDDWEHFKSQLVPCSSCKRTFFPHRLSVHEKSCRGLVNNKFIKSTQKSTDELNFQTKPIFLACNSCGRKYSTTSITLHELKCRNNINMKKLSGKNEINEMNIVWEHFKTQLIPCSKCKRKFLPERLAKHEPNCKAHPFNSSIKYS